MVKIKLERKSFLWYTCFFSIALILLIELYIIGVILFKGIRIINLDFFFTYPGLNINEGGVYPYIVGNFILVFLMTIFVFPIGVFTGIYLYEYAKDNFLYRLIKIAIYNLAGIPSIVYGLFGLSFFIRFLGKGIDNLFFEGNLVLGQPAIIWSALTLALLTLPTVIIATEESLKSVAKEYREASYALGANPIQNLFGIVVPLALPGILTGLILALGRGAGEVAPILFTGVAYYVSEIPLNLNDQFMHLGYYIYGLFTQSPNLKEVEVRLYGCVFVFLMITLIISISISYIRYRILKRWHKF